MPIDHQRLMDGIEGTISYWREVRRAAGLRPAEREEILGMKYRKGEEVKDNVSGQKATVIAGTRAIVGVQGP